MDHGTVSFGSSTNGIADGLRQMDVLASDMNAS
jgi:hypothetical protein